LEWSTHLLSGVVAGYLVTGGDPKGALVGGVASVISDLDEPKSKFGKIFLPISLPLNQMFGHLTFTHSLLFAGLMGAVFYFLINKALALAVVAGVLAHIVGDMLTGKVKLFYPLKMSVGIGIPHSLFTLMDGLARVLLILLIMKIIYNDYVVKHLHALGVF